MERFQQLIDFMLTQKQQGAASEAIDKSFDEMAVILASARGEQRQLLVELDRLRDANIKAREDLDSLALKRHNLRMLFELRQRKLEDAKLKKKEEEKAQIEKVVQSKTALAAEVQNKFRDMLAQMADIQKRLDIPTIPNRGTAESIAEMLPGPLYVLYRQLQAFIRLYSDPSSVSVQWSGPEQAEQWKAQVNGDYPSDQTPEEQRATKRQRLERLRDEEPDQMLRVAPFAVELEIRPLFPQQGEGQPATPGPASTSGSGAPPPLKVTFEYLDRLGLVCARASSDPKDNYLLNELTKPGDLGAKLPGMEAMDVFGDTEFDPSRPARPYEWCQYLAMVDLVPSANPFAFGVEDSRAARAFDAKLISIKDTRAVNVVYELRARYQAALDHRAVFNMLQKLRGRSSTQGISAAQLLPKDAVPLIPERYRTPESKAEVTEIYRRTSVCRHTLADHKANLWEALLDMWKFTVVLGPVRVEFEVLCDSAMKIRSSLTINKVHGGGLQVTPEIIAELSARINAAAEKVVPEGREGLMLGVLFLALAVEAGEYIKNPAGFEITLTAAGTGAPEVEGNGAKEGGDAAEEEGAAQK